MAQLTTWQCSECDYSQPKNKFYVCPNCNKEGTAIPVEGRSGNSGSAKGPARAPGASELAVSSGFVTMAQVAEQRATRGPRATKRIDTGLGEVNRVTGGGLVVGAPYLLYGSWGNGKSTLLTQIIINLARAKLSVAIITGEESDEAWLDRFIRLGAVEADFEYIHITQNTVLDDSLADMVRLRPTLVVADSLQTLSVAGYDGAPSDPGQIKRSMQMMCDFSRNTRITTVIIGQVTKGGDARGDNSVMHAPDCTLALEGEDRYGLRILRASKNRHGTTDEIGIFEMGGLGLTEIPDPSKLFVADRPFPVPGAVICPVIEGQRTVLVEVTALVAPTNAEKPVREVVGYDKKRFNLMLMALNQHCGLRLGGFDIGLSLADGMKITDPALDLAVCVAIGSAYVNAAPQKPLAACGQVTLLGEVRTVPMLEKRIGEAARLNFGDIITSNNAKTLREAIEAATGGSLRRKPSEFERAADGEED